MLQDTTGSFRLWLPLLAQAGENIQDAQQQVGPRAGRFCSPAEAEVRNQREQVEGRGEGIRPTHQVNDVLNVDGVCSEETGTQAAPLQGQLQ